MGLILRTGKTIRTIVMISEWIISSSAHNLPVKYYPSDQVDTVTRTNVGSRATEDIVMTLVTGGSIVM